MVRNVKRETTRPRSKIRTGRRHGHPRATPRGAFLQAIIGFAISGSLLLLGLFSIWNARWPVFAKVLWLVISGVGTVGTFWASLKAFWRLPMRDRSLVGLAFLALGVLGQGQVRSWSEILAYKVRNATVQVQAAWQRWRARGTVYVLAEDRHGVSHLLPDGKGAVLAVSAFEVRRFVLDGGGRVHADTLLSRADLRSSGIHPTPLTACARGRNGLLCMNLFGEVIQRRQGRWSRLATFPAPGDQFYDALAVGPDDALYAWTNRGRHPQAAYWGIWRLDPATGRATRIMERVPEALVVARHAVWALFSDRLEALNPGGKRIPLDLRRYGAARYAVWDAQGRFLVATGHAVLQVGEEGIVTPLWQQPGADYDVRSLAIAPDGRPVLATWDDGLVLDAGTGEFTPFGIRERFLWHHLQDLAPGPEGWIWVAAADRDTGLVALHWPDLVRYIRLHRADAPEEDVRRFADARQALESLYPQGPPEGTGVLSLDSSSIPGGGLVAWHGEAVWPRDLAGLPYRKRPLGIVHSLERYALIDRNRPGRLMVYEKGRHRDLKLPPGHLVMRVLLDDHDRVWIGTRQGVYLESSPGNLRLIRELPARWVGDIVEDRHGRVWIAFISRNTDTRHVPGRLFLHDGNAWRELQVDRAGLQMYRRGSPSGRHNAPCDLLLSTDINDIEPLRDGRVALATDLGIVLHDGQRAKCFGPNEALPVPSVTRIREDLQGRLFFFDYTGRLHWFDGRLHIYHTIDAASGLFHREAVDAWTDPRDRLWVLDTDGAVDVAPIRHYY